MAATENERPRAAPDAAQRLGSIVLPIDGVNYITRTITFFNRRNDQELLHYSLALDVNGKYRLGHLKNQSTFGFVLAAQEDVSKF